MNQRFTPFLITALLVAIVVGCGPINKMFKKRNNGPLVGKINNRSFYLTDLRANYQPVGVVEDTLAELTNFLPSFLDYQVKIMEANKAGLFENEELLSEYEDFGTRAAYAYWIENDIKEAMLQDFMLRAEEEVRVSYMLINLSTSASPEDTLEAYDRLLEARQKILNGADFDSLSNIYSSKSRGRSVGGELYYVSAGTTVLPFENQMYDLTVGEVSMPFRSQYGMHLAQVNDRRPRAKDRKLSHIILFDRSREYSEKTQDSLIQVLQPVYEQLIKGADWDSLVQEYSMDAASRNRNGEIGWVNYGRYNETFSDTVMSMPTELGSLTEPFYSGYGVQIIRLDSIREFKSSQERKDFFEKQLKELPRYKADENIVRAKIKGMLDIQIDSTAIGNYLLEMAKLDTIKIKNVVADDLPLASSKTYPLVIGDLKYDFKKITDFFTDRYPELYSGKAAWSMINEVVDHAVDKHLLNISRETFRAFDQTMESYLNGLAVFKITEDSVWNYVKMDTSKLMNLYERQKDQYQLPERVEFIRFASVSDSLLNRAVDSYKNGITDLDSLSAMYPRLVIQHDSTSYINEEPFTPLQTLQIDEFSDQYSFKGRKTIILKKANLAARTMRFDEAIFRVISDMQVIREKEWNEVLRKRYNIESMPENLQNISSK